MKKETFELSYYFAKKDFGEINKMVVAVRLPTGATEIIINKEVKVIN